MVRRRRAGGSPLPPQPGACAPRPLPPGHPRRLPRGGGGGSSPPPPALAPGDPAMPVRTECPPPAGASVASAASLIPPPPINTQQPGVATSLLYSGSKFRGHQKSKGNSYDVEVVLQVSAGPGRRGPRASSRRSQAEPARLLEPQLRARPSPRASRTRRLTPGLPGCVHTVRAPAPTCPRTPSPSWAAPGRPRTRPRPEAWPASWDPEAPMAGHPHTWVLPVRDLSSEDQPPCSPSQTLHTLR